MKSVKIPQSLIVGYNSPEKKLSYVTYQENGKVKQPVAFNNWIDPNVEIDRYSNTIMKKLEFVGWGGGVEHSWGYDARKTYVRVKDERGFVFEVTVENFLELLYWSYKLKGTNNMFIEHVIGWNGTQVCIVPVKDPEYAVSLKLKTETPIVKSSNAILGNWYIRKGGEPMKYLMKVKLMSYRISEYPVFDSGTFKRLYETKDIHDPEVEMILRKYQEKNLPQHYPNFSIDKGRVDKNYSYIFWSSSEGLKIYKYFPDNLYGYPEVPSNTLKEQANKVYEQILFFGEPIWTRLETLPLSDFTDMVKSDSYSSFSSTNFGGVLTTIKKLEDGKVMLYLPYIARLTDSTYRSCIILYLNVNTRADIRDLYNILNPMKIVVKYGTDPENSKELTDTSYILNHLISGYN